MLTASAGWFKGAAEVVGKSRMFEQQLSKSAGGLSSKIAAAARERLDGLLSIGLENSGLLALKASRFRSTVGYLMESASAEEIEACQRALFDGAGWSGPNPVRSALIQSPECIVPLASKLVSCLTNDWLGYTGLPANIERYANEGASIVFVANQRFFTDSALIARGIDRVSPGRLVEFSCADSFPNHLTRALLQAGRSIVRTNESVHEAVAGEALQLAGSPWATMFQAMREGKWPLIFPEAQGFRDMEKRDERLMSKLLGKEVGRVADMHAFNPHVLAPLMTDTPETLGIDPQRVVLIPVKIANDGNVWPRYSICDEIDIIVKFGEGISLCELHQEFGRVGDLPSLIKAARFLRSAVHGLGETYLD
jgi:hypothetical protein